MDYYQEGYDKGYGDGRSGRPADRGYLMDFLNTKTQQEYDDGYDEGYEDGKEAREREE